MKVVILAGGLGTRLAEATSVVPKPMVEIGGRPILWHIMKHYAHFGHDEFFIACGYKAEIIKRFFLEYNRLEGDLRVSLSTGHVTVTDHRAEDWQVNLIDTGLHTNTGGRLAALRDHLGDETFLLTYGDGVSDVDLNDLIAFHKAQGLAATVTAVRPPARYGGLVFDGDRVKAFTEKPQIGEGWINGGFFVLEPQVFDYLDKPGASLEINALEPLAAAGQLAAYKHDRFWQCMDTLREVQLLERLWAGDAPWRLWRD